MSVTLIGFGIISALVAAVFGFIDYGTAPMPADAKKTATTHMICNLLVVVIFVIAYFVRKDDPTATFGYILTVLGVVLLAYSGYLGGHLSYHYGVGVEAGAGSAAR